MSKGLQWSDCIALFGGTFDPPHLGHAEAVEGLFRNPGVREVWILPAAIPALKSARTEADRRVELCRLAFASLLAGGRTRLDLREIERARPGSPPSYTYDTLRSLPEAEFAFVIGTDQLETLPRWHRFPEVLGASHWIVLNRKARSEEGWRAVLADWTGSGLLTADGGNQTWRIRTSGRPRWLKLVDTDAAALTSTQIREHIARTGQVPPASVAPAVSDYLMRNRLYGTKPGE